MTREASRITSEIDPVPQSPQKPTVEGITARTVLHRFDKLPGFYPFLGLFIGVAIWEMLGQLFDLLFLPPFTAVLARLYSLILDGTIPSDLVLSLQNLGLGFTIALVLGVTVGVLMGWFSHVEKALDPYIYALLTSPTIVFAPIYFSIFGLSRWAIVGLIVQYATLVITVNTCAGVKGVATELVEMCQVFGGSERAVLRKIVIPFALPFAMAGIRLGMARAVLGMVNGELLIAVIGLGATSAAFGRAFDAEGVLAMVLVVIIVALICTSLVRAVDNHINSWLPSTHR